MFALLSLLLVWRIDNPRVERIRTELIDATLPKFEWALVPVSSFMRMVGDFQSYRNIYEQNQQLRRELQQMKEWKEAAIQLEQKNARLLDLNNVRLDPKLTYVTGRVVADSGSPFRQSVLMNIGTRDGVRDGWAAIDGIGLVGRVSGVGTETSRVILLNDPASAVPVTIQPSGQKAMLIGDNSNFPLIDFIESSDDVRPGDRVITSGDGDVFPADLLIGQVAQGADRRLRVHLAADYERLEFLRVLRHRGQERIDENGGLVGWPDPEPPREMFGPFLPQPEAKADG
ncbi:rod shape-determining protein MreC [Qingshengfaniella alkalisoli]|uniref:Cell shape-determining protein MreC n=2 Tax=Qingshengfaniella alkalisoli TaxID=2599296 RepID=A0A5B8J739_9RHOB|nr:rod shape-determining protein MreC [Qingshengfaniella alkalisoli]